MQISAQDPDVATAAKRNLALALYRRGWKLMRDGKAAEAAADFERATRDPSVLKGTEPLAFEFSYALALLDAGRARRGREAVQGRSRPRATRPRTSRAPYAQGRHRSSSRPTRATAAGTLAARQQAAAELRASSRPSVGRRRQDQASCSRRAGSRSPYEQWRAGQIGAAAQVARDRREVRRPATEAPDRDRPRRARARQGRARRRSRRSPATPPEALVNLGIVYDQLGRPKDAYDAWTARARRAACRARDLQKWIDAKKRIYGY